MEHSNKQQAPVESIARPIEHLLHPVPECHDHHAATHMPPNKDSSINKEVVDTAVTGYN